MAIKDDIIAAIQAVADASGSGNIRISLGAPGDHVENSIGETQPTGAAWLPEPKTWPVIIEGIAEWLTAQNVGGPPKFMTVQQRSTSGNVNSGVDLVELTAAGITVSLPDPTSIPPYTKVVAKSKGHAGNFVNVQGGANIDAGPIMGFGAPYDALRFYSDGTQWWTW